jgi:ribosomal protein L40E
MKLQVLIVGIIVLLVGGVIEAIGVSEFFSCTSNFFSTFSTCNVAQPTALLVFGGVLFFIGIVVTILGAWLGVAPQLKGLGLPGVSNPIVTEKETVVTREVLIQCRSCGARYPQGTLKCLTCGANL